MSRMVPESDELLIHELELDGLTLSHEVGPVAPARTAAGRLRQALAEAGGVAGAAELARRAGLASPRAVRGALRGGEVQSLGAGYMALPAGIEPPVGAWLEAQLLRAGPVPLDEAVGAVLAHYPHGDAGAVRAWLAQEPGRLRVDEGMVWVLGGARPAPWEEE